MSLDHLRGVFTRWFFFLQIIAQKDFKEISSLSHNVDMNFLETQEVLFISSNRVSSVKFLPFKLSIFVSSYCEFNLWVCGVMKVYIDMLARNVKKRFLNLITIKLGSSIKIANKEENLREGRLKRRGAFEGIESYGGMYKVR